MLHEGPNGVEPRLVPLSLRVPTAPATMSAAERYKAGLEFIRQEKFHDGMEALEHALVLQAAAGPSQASAAAQVRDNSLGGPASTHAALRLGYGLA